MFIFSVNINKTYTEPRPGGCSGLDNPGVLGVDKSERVEGGQVTLGLAL